MSWLVAKILSGLIFLLITHGFILGFLLLGLSHLYDWLSERTDLPLKYSALIPPLVLIPIGLFTSIEFIPYVIFLYGLVILLLCLGRQFVFDRLDWHIINRLIVSGLLAVVAIPFMLLALLIFAGILGPGRYSFDIHNQSGHDIVVQEVQVNGVLIFPNEDSRYCNHEAKPNPSSVPSADGKHLEADLSRWPGTISLRVYDAELEKEIRGKVRLPRYEKHSTCAFDIIYEAGEFRYDDRICG